MAGLGDVIGEGSTARQLFEWAVLQAVVAAFFQPYIQRVTNDVQARNPVMPLSPAEAATAANRSFITSEEGAAQAAQSGVPADDFAILQHLAGQAPSPTDLVTALRRGLIDRTGTGAGSTSFEQGIAEGNLSVKWTDVVAGLAAQWPTPADALRAALQGQVTADEGKALYERWGGDPQWYQVMLNTEGSAPTPLEALQMAQRGFIPWTGRGPDVTSFEQAFLEGPWRDKWQPAYQSFAAWYPTVSEALELYRYGQADRAQASQMMALRGLDAGQIGMWLGYADQNAVTDYRGLTESVILQMIAVGYVTDEQARTMLAALHEGPAAIDTLISYAHIQRTITSLNNAVARIGNLYQGRKITPDTARNALVRLHIPGTAIGDIMADWDAVASINVKTLTETQIVDAWAAGIITQDEAVTELGNVGYTPYDAWLLLSIKAKGPLPGKPAQGPAAPLGAVTPGTT